MAGLVFLWVALERVRREAMMVVQPDVEPRPLGVRLELGTYERKLQAWREALWATARKGWAATALGNACHATM